MRSRSSGGCLGRIFKTVILLAILTAVIVVGVLVVQILRSFGSSGTGGAAEGDVSYNEEETLMFTSNGDGTCNVASTEGADATSVVIPATSPAGDRVTSIATNGFAYQTKLTSVSFEENEHLTALGFGAFSNCTSLVNITLPESINEIGEAAFSYCTALTSITLPGTISELPGGMLLGCENLLSIRIPASVSVIGEQALIGCTRLSTVIFEDGSTLYKIGSGAFQACSGLVAITLPTSLTDIGDSAFCYCSGLSSLTLPEGLLRVGQFAFAGCGNVEVLTLPSTLSYIGPQAFDGLARLSLLTVAQGSPYYRSVDNCVIDVARGELVFGCTSSIIPADGSITSIGDFAFRGSGIRELSIPASVTFVGKDAFADCANLSFATYEGGKYLGNADNPYHVLLGPTSDSITSLVLHEGTAVMAKEAFKGHKKLWGLTFNENLTAIPASAFEGCTGLYNITIPSNAAITAIGEYAFRGCNAFLSITLPNNVQTVGVGAFLECEALTSVIFPSGYSWNAGETYIPARTMMIASTNAVNIKRLYADCIWTRGSKN